LGAGLRLADLIVATAMALLFLNSSYLILRQAREEYRHDDANVESRL
jgi:hypothetical protein